MTHRDPLHGKFLVEVRYFEAGVERALLRERVSSNGPGSLFTTRGP